MRKHPVEDGFNSHPFDWKQALLLITKNTNHNYTGEHKKSNHCFRDILSRTTRRSLRFAYPRHFNVAFFLVDVTGKSKICNLHDVILTYQHIASSDVTMHTLEKKTRYVKRLHKRISLENRLVNYSINLITI